jgi:hypothetical protein
VTVLKNEMHVGRLKARYERAREAVEDLTDAWISSLRRKKKIQRKQARPCCLLCALLAGLPC